MFLFLFFLWPNVLRLTSYSPLPKCPKRNAGFTKNSPKFSSSRNPAFKPNWSQIATNTLSLILHWPTKPNPKLSLSTLSHARQVVHLQCSPPADLLIHYFNPTHYVNQAKTLHYPCPLQDHLMNPAKIPCKLLPPPENLPPPTVNAPFFGLTSSLCP